MRSLTTIIATLISLIMFGGICFSGIQESSGSNSAKRIRIKTVYSGSLEGSGTNLDSVLQYIDSSWKSSAFIYQDTDNLYLPLGKYLGVGTIPKEGIEIAVNGIVQATHFQTSNQRAGVYEGTIYTDGLIYGMDIEATRRFMVDESPGISWSGDITQLKALTIEGGIITGVAIND